jgi:hypothetical protein
MAYRFETCHLKRCEEAERKQVARTGKGASSRKEPSIHHGGALPFFCNDMEKDN